MCHGSRINDSAETRAASQLVEPSLFFLPRKFLFSLSRNQEVFFLCTSRRFLASKTHETEKGEVRKRLNSLITFYSLHPTLTRPRLQLSPFFSHSPSAFPNTRLLKTSSSSKKNDTSNLSKHKSILRCHSLSFFDTSSFL